MAKPHSIPQLPQHPNMFPANDKEKNVPNSGSCEVFKLNVSYSIALGFSFFLFSFLLHDPHFNQGSMTLPFKLGYWLFFPDDDFHYFPVYLMKSPWWLVSLCCLLLFIYHQSLSSFSMPLEVLYSFCSISENLTKRSRGKLTAFKFPTILGLGTQLAQAFSSLRQQPFVFRKMNKA